VAASYASLDAGNFGATSIAAADDLYAYVVSSLFFRGDGAGRRAPILMQYSGRS